MPTEPIAAFLEAEQEAERLVDVLKRLQQEVESYQSARSALSAVSAKLAEAGGTMQTTASRLADVIQTLRTIGTPELLQAQEKVSVRVAELEKRLREAISTMNRTPETIGKVADAVRQEAAALDERLSSRLENAEKRIESLQDTLRETSKQGLKSIRRNVVAFAVIIVVVQIITALSVILRP